MMIVIVIAYVNVIVIIIKVIVIIELSPSRHDPQTLIQEFFVTLKKPSGVNHPNLLVHIVFLKQNSSFTSRALFKGTLFGISEGSLQSTFEINFKMFKDMRKTLIKCAVYFYLSRISFFYLFLKLLYVRSLAFIRFATPTYFLCKTIDVSLSDCEIQSDVALRTLCYYGHSATEDKSQPPRRNA